MKVFPSVMMPIGNNQLGWTVYAPGPSIGWHPVFTCKQWKRNTVDDACLPRVPLHEPSCCSWQLSVHYPSSSTGHEGVLRRSWESRIHADVQGAISTTMQPVGHAHIGGFSLLPIHACHAPAARKQKEGGVVLFVCQWDGRRTTLGTELVIDHWGASFKLASLMGRSCGGRKTVNWSISGFNGSPVQRHQHSVPMGSQRRSSEADATD